MALIQSNKCVLQIKVGDTYKTIMCCRSFNVNTTTSEKETTTPIDGKFKDFDYSQLSCRASLDGVLYRETTGNTVFDFAKAQLNFIELNVRAIYEDIAGNVHVFRAQMIVMDANIDASAGQVGSGTVELLGKGEYFIEDSLPEYVNLRIRLYNNDTSEAFFKFWLINSDGEAVFQTDTLDQASGGQLANPLDITVPVPKGNWYYWFQVTTNNVNNVFNLNAPPTKTTNFNNGVVNEGSFPTQLYDFTANREVSVQLGVPVTPPVCVPVSIPGSPSLPDGVLNIPYSYTFPLIGTAPFTIFNVVKPTWMNITTFESSGTTYVQLAGTPNSFGGPITVSFDISNACGSTSFSDTFSVDDNPDLITVDYTFGVVTEPPSTAYTFIIYVNGVEAVNVNDNASGSLSVNPGDVIEADVFGPDGAFRSLAVQDTITGTLYDDNTTSFGLIYSWTAISGHDYNVNSIVDSTTP